MNETQQKIYTQAKGKWDAIAKPIDILGVFEDMVARLCAIAGTVNPGDYKRRALLTLCADHGVVAEGVTQTDASVTKVVAENIAHGCSGVNYMAQMAGVDVYAVDIGMRGEAYPDATFGMGHMINRKVQAGTGNLAKEPAMSMEICDRAIEAGKELVRECKEKGYEILAVGEMGIGNTTTSTAVAAALLDLEVEQVTGKGAGLTDEALKRKCRVIEEAIEKYFLRDADAFTILKTVGGLDIAGLTGVFIGAAIEQIPVVIDGVISAVAALLAETFCKGAVNYMIPSHKSRELAETAIMKKLHLDPVLDADMALGEGTGAVMMMSLLDVALGVYLQGASFANFEIEQYKRYEE